MNKWKMVLISLAVAVPSGVLPAAAAQPAAAQPMTVQPATAPPSTAPIKNNETQPIYSRTDALTETVFVEVAGVDSDATAAPTGSRSTSCGPRRPRQG